jgi:hypothetical protein
MALFAATWIFRTYKNMYNPSLSHWTGIILCTSVHQPATDLPPATSGLIIYLVSSLLRNPELWANREAPLRFSYSIMAVARADRVEQSYLNFSPSFLVFPFLWFRFGFWGLGFKFGV